MAKGIRFVPDMAGYAAIMNSADVQRSVADKANEVARAARSMLDQDEGYALDDFEVKDFRGKLADGKVVRTKTDHARYSQAKNKTLTKALKSL